MKQEPFKVTEETKYEQNGQYFKLKIIEKICFSVICKFKHIFSLRNVLPLKNDIVSRIYLIELKF